MHLDLQTGTMRRISSRRIVFSVFGPPLAMASVVCAAGSLAMARRAESRELPGVAGKPNG